MELWKSLIRPNPNLWRVNFLMRVFKKFYESRKIQVVKHIIFQASQLYAYSKNPPGYLFARWAISRLSTSSVFPAGLLSKASDKRSYLLLTVGGPASWRASLASGTRMMTPHPPAFFHPACQKPCEQIPFSLTPLLIKTWGQRWNNNTGCESFIKKEKGTRVGFTKIWL